jgi:hypothetical protein
VRDAEQGLVAADLDGGVIKQRIAALKKLAAELLAYDDKTLVRVVASGVLVKVAL